MNDINLIREGLKQRAFKAFVIGREAKAYQLLRWARELR